MSDIHVLDGIEEEHSTAVTRTGSKTREKSMSRRKATSKKLSSAKEVCVCSVKFRGLRIHLLVQSSYNLSSNRWVFIVYPKLILWDFCNFIVCISNVFLYRFFHSLHSYFMIIIFGSLWFLVSSSMQRTRYGDLTVWCTWFMSSCHTLSSIQKSWGWRRTEGQCDTIRTEEPSTIRCADL